MTRAARDLLRTIPLFDGLDGAALEALAALARSRSCAPGVVIVAEGDLGDAVHLIVSGRTTVSVATAGGRSATLGEMGPAEIVGEISLLDGGARSATVTALTAVELLSIDRAPFLALLERTPRVAVALLVVVAGRLRRLTHWADDLAGLPVPARIAKRLLGLLVEHGQQTGPCRFRIALKLSQPELAARVGATRESVNKHLRRWQRAGIIEQEAGHIVVTKLERLQSEAAGP